MADLALTRSSPHRFRWLSRLTIGILIGTAGLWWAMRDLDMPVMVRTLISASPAWIIVSLVSVMAVALAKAARWGALYGTVEPQPSFGELFSVLVATQMVNLIIPIRLGELIRIGLMKRAGQSGAATVLTIIVEKALDLMGTGLVATSLVVLAVGPVWLHESSSGLLLISLTLMVGLTLVWWLRDEVERLLVQILTLGWWPERWQKRLLHMLHTMLKALGTLIDWHTLAQVLFWTIIIWLFSLLTMVALFTAFGLRLPLTAAVVMMLAVTTSNIVPSPPALVGVMQGIAVVVLGQYSVAQSTALGFGIVLNIVTVGPLIVLGSWTLWSRTVPVLACLWERSVDELLAE